MPMPARTGAKPTARQRWLLVYNCQVMGLGNCLNLMCDDVDVEAYDPAAFQKQSATLLERRDEFDRVLVSPKLEVNLAIDRSLFPGFWSIPTIFFHAYHPDLCHLLVDGKPLKGPMGDYHSLIAYAAFRRGLSVRQTLRLYREEVYAALGYLGVWDDARDTLLRQFRDANVPLEPHFRNWSRNGPFMYANNHPRIHAIRDVAKAILGSAGLDATYTDALPHDNLANAPIFPVYPEVASTLGVEGSYRFKPAGYGGFIDLEAFVTRSHGLYGQVDATIHPLHQSLFETTLPMIAELQ